VRNVTCKADVPVDMYLLPKHNKKHHNIFVILANSQHFIAEKVYKCNTIMVNLNYIRHDSYSKISSTHLIFTSLSCLQLSHNLTLFGNLFL